MRVQMSSNCDFISPISELFDLFSFASCIATFFGHLLGYLGFKVMRFA